MKNCQINQINILEINLKLNLKKYIKIIHTHDFFIFSLFKNDIIIKQIMLYIGLKIFIGLFKITII